MSGDSPRQGNRLIPSNPVMELGNKTLIHSLTVSPWLLPLQHPALVSPRQRVGITFVGKEGEDAFTSEQEFGGKDPRRKQNLREKMVLFLAGCYPNPFCLLSQHSPEDAFAKSSPQLPVLLPGPKRASYQENALRPAQLPGGSALGMGMREQEVVCLLFPPHCPPVVLFSTSPEPSTRRGRGTESMVQWGRK